jgi:hypothetical protein
MRTCDMIGCMQTPSHIPVLLARLERDIRSAVERAIEDLIPPWTTGVQQTFWLTNEGQQLANWLWLINRDQAVTVRDALPIIWPDVRRQWHYRSVIQLLPLYPLPANAKTADGKRFPRNYPFYLLLSDVDEFAENRRRTPAPQLSDELREWLLADENRMILDAPTLVRMFAQDAKLIVTRDTINKAKKQIKDAKNG